MLLFYSPKNATLSRSTVTNIRNMLERHIVPELIYIIQGVEQDNSDEKKQEEEHLKTLVNVEKKVAIPLVT